MLNAQQVLKLFETHAPLSLSADYCEHYSAYDNSGIIFDSALETDGVLCALDLTEEAVRRADELGYKLILTHHPAIYSPVSKILRSDCLTPCGALAAAAVKGISVISMHLNADTAVDGIDFSLMNAVRIASGRIPIKPRGPGVQIFEPLARLGTGYGRRFEINPVSLASLAEGIKKELGARNAFVFGDEERILTSACSFCGAGLNEESLAFAHMNGAQVVVTAEVKHHILTAAAEAGISVIQLTHYASENYGFKRLCLSVFADSELKAEYYTDGAML